MKKQFHNLRIGILGGGQLGRMLLQKAADFSLDIKVLDPDPTAPCRYLAHEFVHGNFNDYDTVMAFGKDCDLITIEIEHVSTAALAELEKQGVAVYPQPSVIAMVQDKGEQKKFYSENNFPTAPFFLANNRQEMEDAVISFPVIQKLRKGGYDGRGIKKINSVAEISTAFDDPSVIEELIPFEKELAVIVARNTNADCRAFPAVEMEFNDEANLVEFLFSPAQISEQTEKQAVEIAIRLANTLKITGVLAVEFFLTADGKLFVNEIAPRPHNSGHHTIEANKTSQYEQHLRAILGLTLGDTASNTPAVMVNLLGEKNHEGEVFYEGIENAIKSEGVNIHLYGKKFTRPFRKMGHVTITSATLAEARKKAVEVKNAIKVISKK
jgi:5-(carboxyamino)imidazole ribonucleotide synthase